MTFARRVFLAAAIYGLAVLLPLYFFEDRIATDMPPAIAHPEYYYGFVGSAVAWQLVFLVISRDPVRHRALIGPAIVEKLAYGVPVWVLALQGRGYPLIVAFGTIDLAWGALFATSWLRLRREAVASAR